MSKHTFTQLTFGDVFRSEAICLELPWECGRPTLSSTQIWIFNADVVREGIIRHVRRLALVLSLLELAR